MKFLGPKDRADISASRSSPPLAAEWWPAAACLTAGLIVLLALFWEAAAAAVHTWSTSSSFNHAFLILPICGYLVWLRWRRLEALTPRPSYPGLALMALAGLGWLLGDITGLLVIEQLALVGMIQALTLTVLGWRITRAMLFPLFYLFFAVPIGEFMVAPLQDFTAVFVVRALQMTGMPVFLDGIFISIPSGNFEVAETCAGVRFLTATTALGFLGANLFYRSNWRRILFVALAIIIPIIANGMRAYGIVMIAHLSDYEIAVGVDHLVYGWVFFGFVTVVLLLVGMTFWEHTNISGSSGNEVLRAPIASASRASARGPIVAAGLAALLIAGAAPTYAGYMDGILSGRTVGDIVEMQVQSPWQHTAALGRRWQPTFQGADRRSLQHFIRDGRRIDLFIAYYAYQRQGAEAVNSQNRFGDGKEWTRVGGGQFPAQVDSSPLRVSYTRLLSRRGGRIVWHWYWVDGEFTANPLLAKALQARARIFGGNEAAAVIAVATDYRDRPAEAAPVLSDFLAHVAPLASMLERAAGSAAEDR